jgi:MoxR-like ATPase
MRVAAATEGRTEIDALDLWLAPYIASASPQDVPHLAAWFETELIGAVPQQAPWLTRAVQAFERQLEIEQSAQDDPDAANAAGKLALARAIGAAGEADDRSPLRIVSRTLEEQMRRRYSVVHIQARLAQLDEIIGQARAQADAVATLEQQLALRLRRRLWLPPELAQRMLDAHAHTGTVLQGLLSRLGAVRAGFAALPIDPQLDAVVPAPVPLADVTA